MNHTSLDQVIFTFLDVETTGLNPHSGDRICEIALLRCKGGQELAAFQTLVNPGRPISPGAHAVNHITDSMVAHAPPFQSIAVRALQFLEGAVLVAHNAPFDLSFLNLQLNLLGLSLPCNQVIDTLSMARSLYRFPSNSLRNLKRYMGLPQREEHRAMVDVLTTRDLFLRMMADLRSKGVKTLEKLVDMQTARKQANHKRAVILPLEIEEALKKGGRMRIRYVSGSHRATERVIRPQEVEVLGNAVYLVAHCYLRNEERTFRLDRIIDIAPITEED